MMSCSTGKPLYTITQIVQFTGLTDRTIRSYIASGILQGEKHSGRWIFSEDQFNEFIRHPTVRPSIQAKGNAIIHDFILAENKSADECCIIIDLPEEAPEQIATFFCTAIPATELHKFRFAFDGIGSTPRVILSGHFDEISALLNAFRGRKI